MCRGATILLIRHVLLFPVAFLGVHRVVRRLDSPFTVGGEVTFTLRPPLTIRKTTGEWTPGP